ncbi:MAG: hypothetical protein AD073_000006 [Mycoplasmataceae bacterium]|nr:MAG: hypothetical protein AD073_000006 [Mycoplasmataceae bacterium]
MIMLMLNIWKNNGSLLILISLRKILINLSFYKELIINSNKWKKNNLKF